MPSTKARFSDEQIQQWIKDYKLPIVSYAWATDALPGVPERWTVNVEVAKGRVVTMDYYYVTSDAEMQHLDAWLATQKSFGLDVETGGAKNWDGLDPLSTTSGIGTIQVGNPFAAEPRAYCICARSVSEAGFAPLKARCESRDVIKLTQNGRFEYKWLKHKKGWNTRQLADTQVAEMIVRAGLLNRKEEQAKDRGKGADRGPYKYTSMAALAKRYLEIDIDKDKDLRTGFWDTPAKQLTPRQIMYANSDTIYIYPIAEGQRPEIEARKLKNIIKIEFELIPVLGDAELAGFGIDAEKWQDLWREALIGRAKAERTLDNLLLALDGNLFGAEHGGQVRPLYFNKKSKPQEINYDSSAQVLWAIEHYCTMTGWNRKLLTTWPAVWKAKAKEGAAWLAKSQTKWDEQIARGEDPKWERPTERDIPDWVLDERVYCMLTGADKDTLKLRLARGQLPAELIKPLIEYSMYSIRCDSFGNEFLKKNVRLETLRIHTEFHQAITQTGRLSTSPNLQNIPNDQRYRECFVPRKGYVLVIADHSQVEPRITAEMSGDGVYTATFINDDDLYLAVAEAMLGYRPDKHTEEGARERAIFKTVVLALAYSMGAAKLRDRLTLALYDDILTGKAEAPTFEYAKELFTRFFEVHEKVKEFQDYCVSMADPAVSKRKIWDSFLGAEVTYVESLCGRKRFFPPDALSTKTEAPNVGPQSGSATFTKVAACLIHREIEANQYDAVIVNLVHDEIVVECHASIAHEMAKIVKECMTKAGQYFCKTVPIKSEWPEGSAGFVPFWAKKVKPAQMEQITALVERATTARAALQVAA